MLLQEECQTMLGSVRDGELLGWILPTDAEANSCGSTVQESTIGTSVAGIALLKHICLSPAAHFILFLL